MHELTPDEASFFETGELPESLLPKVETPTVTVVEPPAPNPQPEVAVEAPPAPVATTFDMNALDRILEEKFARLQAQYIPPAPTPKEVVPDRDTDPLGNMLHNIESINQRLTQNEQTSAARAQMDQFTSTCQAAKTDFESRQPDFKDAYAHIRTLRSEDLRAVGAAEKDIPNILLQDEFQLAQTALQRGKNPAEELYSMAKRYGYAPKAPAPTQSAAALPSAAQKMDKISAGQAADHNPGKSTTEAELTLAGLKDVSSRDLDKLVQDNKLWSSIVGGNSPSDIFS